MAVSAAISEKQLQNRIIEFLNEATKGTFWQNDSIGIRGRKRENKYRPNGVPDVIGVVDGQFIGIEVKSKTGRMLPSQIEFSARLTAAGGYYFIIKSMDDLIETSKIFGWVKSELAS